MKNYKKYFILIIILIILILVFGIYKLFNTSKNPILDNSHDIVYLYYKSEDNRKKVPAVNIKKISDNINYSINEFVNPYLDKDYISIDYHYNVSGNILSLFVTIIDYSREGSPDYNFKSYIVNLKTLKILDNNNNILKLFNTNMDNIVSILDKQFKNFYNEEKEKNIIDKNITYNSYLKSHDISSFKDQISFDIVNSKLVIYIDFNEYADIEKEYYFKEIGHVYYYE